VDFILFAVGPHRTSPSIGLDSYEPSFLNGHESTQALEDRGVDVEENSRCASDGLEDKDSECEYGLDAVI
jgi:hypothetical protein